MGQNPGLPFLAGDLYALPFPNATFDHVFACYVLEHLERPGRALENLLRVLKPGGTLTSVEGDHGSCFFYPETPEALAAWACLPELQALLGGDSLIGRRMYSVLAGAGFSDVWVEPIRIYCDPSLPRMMKGFVEDTIVGMLRGIESEVIERGMLRPGEELFSMNNRHKAKVRADGSLIGALGLTGLATGAAGGAAALGTSVMLLGRPAPAALRARTHIV